MQCSRERDDAIALLWLNRDPIEKQWTFSHAFSLALRKGILRDLCNPRPSRIKGSSQRLTGRHRRRRRRHRVCINYWAHIESRKRVWNRFRWTRTPYSRLDADIKCRRILRRQTQLAEGVHDLRGRYTGIIKLAPSSRGLFRYIRLFENRLPFSSNERW